ERRPARLTRLPAGGAHAGFAARGGGRAVQFSADVSAASVTAAPPVPGHPLTQGPQRFQATLHRKGCTSKCSPELARTGPRRHACKGLSTPVSTGLEFRRGAGSSTTARWGSGFGCTAACFSADAGPGHTIRG